MIFRDPFIRLIYKSCDIGRYHKHYCSVAEPEPRGAATFRVELEPIAGAAPAASFWQAKKVSLVDFVIVKKHVSRAIYTGKCNPTKTCINNSFLGAQNEIFFLWSRLEPTQYGRSQNRLRDLGLPEPELPKKVAAPQHCLEHSQFGSRAILLEHH